LARTWRALKQITLCSGAKPARLIAIVRASERAALYEIVAATQWEPHYADVGM
jgi:hypothetical protein